MPSPSFSSLALPAPLLRACADLGFDQPTPVQAQAIPALLEQRDVVGIAQTGTGKTAAFGLPLLAGLEAEGGLQALVLAPTRELAQQSSSALVDFARHLQGIRVVSVYGGSPYGPQIGALKHGAQVVVGTPGRVIDLMQKGHLDATGLRFFVLDEADEMLRMGFAEDVETITRDVPADARKALFSATMPSAIERVADTYLDDPVRIEVTPQASTVDTVEQTYAVVPFAFKEQALARVLVTRSADAAIVFVRTRADAEEVAAQLAGAGLRAAALSGDVAQDERERIIARLRRGSLDILVATDVAARGLDVERIGLVVNYDVPREAEAYVHRIGRTGRAGRSGEALTFFTPKETYRLRRIEKLTGTPMREVAVPTHAQVVEHQARATLRRALERLRRGGLEAYADALEHACTPAAEASDALDTDTDRPAGPAATSAAGREDGDSPATAYAPGANAEALEHGAADAARNPDAGRTNADHPRPIPPSPADVAAALLALACEGTTGIGPRDVSAHIRREVTLDEDGYFVSATFEHGREKAPRKEGRRRQASRPPMSGARAYRIEVGKRDGVRPGAIVGAITNEGGIEGSKLGSITIFPSFSLVEIAGLSQQAAQRIGRARVAGRRLRIREDHGPRRGRPRHRD